MDKILDIQLHHQQLAYWCWVAVSACLIHYYNKEEIQQCDLATRELTSDARSGVSRSCCPPTHHSPCDQPWYVGDVLKHYHLFDQLIDRPASFAKIKDEIDQRHPMVVRLEWQEGLTHNPAHFVMICGYAQKAGDDYVVVADPASGHLGDDQESGHHEYIYDDLFVHYIGTTQTKWTHTYFTKPNGQLSTQDTTDTQKTSSSDPSLLGGQKIDTQKISNAKQNLIDKKSSQETSQDLSKSKNKVHVLATKIAEMASDASNDYHETHEIAQDILTKLTLDDGGASLNNAKNAGSLTHRASRGLKQTSRALHRAHLLYTKVLDSQDPEEVNMYLQQISKERTKIELAIKEIMDCKHEMNFLKED